MSLSEKDENGYVILSTYQRMGKDVDDMLAKKKGPQTGKVRGKKGPLHRAAEMGDADEVERLLNEEGCEVSQLCEVPTKQTAQHRHATAAQASHPCPPFPGGLDGAALRGLQRLRGRYDHPFPTRDRHRTEGCGTRDPGNPTPLISRVEPP